MILLVMRQIRNRLNFSLQCMLISFVLISTPLLSQTSSTSDGNWNVGANWTAGAPASNEVVTVTNNMTMNVDINIGNGGSVIVNGGTIDGSATTNDLDISGTGYIEVGGNVTIGGNFDLANDGDFLVKACDTLRIKGNATFRNNSTFSVESCAVFYIEGDLVLRNNNSADVDGNIFVEGDLEARNSAAITGTGNLQVGGTVDIRNSGTIFGNTTPCNFPPCEYGSGVGLPIELKDFSAAYIQKHAIEVNWTTSSEINNNYFTIYFSIDGDNFYQTERIPGAGNSNIEQNYSYILNNIQSDEVYIILRQTDFDGQFEEFKEKVVTRDRNYTSEFLTNFKVYPNPGSGNDIRISTGNSANLIGSTFELIHVSGKIVQSTILNENDLIGEQVFEPFSDLSLSKGVYLIRLINKQGVVTKTYIVQ